MSEDEMSISKRMRAAIADTPAITVLLSRILTMWCR